MSIHDCSCAGSSGSLHDHIMHHIREKKPCRITCADLDALPTRDDFLDRRMQEIFAAKIRRARPILFMCNTVDTAHNVGGRSLFRMYGILPSGDRCCLTLNNAPIFFDVRVPADFSGADEFERHLRKELDVRAATVVKLLPMRGFHTEPCDYVRLSFATLRERTRALRLLGDEFETSNDDTGNYFNVVARNLGFSTAGWNRVENYTIYKTSSNCKFDIAVSLRADGPQDIAPLTAEMRATYPKELQAALDRDATLVATWDTEVYNPIKNGEVAEVGAEYDIFLIATAFGHHHADPFYTVACIEAAAEHPDISLIVECPTERDVIAAILRVWGAMTPDVLQSFNGGRFDWPRLVDKVKRYHMSWLLREKLSARPWTRTSDAPTTDREEDEIIRYGFRGEVVKIDAETMHPVDMVCQFPGVLDVDIWPVFKKLYARAEIVGTGSLNFFLSKNNLAPKEDMNFTQMFKLYEAARANPADLTASTRAMGVIAYYCVIDCVRPHQLCRVRAILTEKREVANLSCMPLYTAYYRADGGRVRNFIGAAAHRAHYAFSNKTVEKEPGEKVHFEGGWVFPPRRGLNVRRPIVALDFQSLYPSIIIGLNKSPDKEVTDPAEVARLRAAGYTLFEVGPVDYECGETKGSPLNTRGSFMTYSVQHNNAADDGYTYKFVGGQKVRDRPALPGESMGILGRILKKLFDMRRPIKSRVIEISKALELQKNGGASDDMRFELGKLDATQKAIKQLSNTFYGEAGNFRSSVYMLEVAGGITWCGRWLIQGRAKFVRAKGWTVQYGDTDSLYLTCPEHLFARMDTDFEAATRGLAIESEEYLARRIEYWTAMVRLTMDQIETLRREVNADLIRLTGGDALGMGYEEVGMPSVLGGQKKYAIVPHIAAVNFDDPEPLVKGIDFVKQGKSPIMRDLGMKCLREALSPRNHRSLYDISIDCIRDFWARGADDIAPYKMMAKYKPAKRNVSVLTFIARMRRARAACLEKGDMQSAALYAIPEPGEKFEYVIVQKAQAFTIDGRMIDMKIGDKMEFVSVYNASQRLPNPMRIDTAYYMNRDILSMFARFIAYHPMFEPDDKSLLEIYEDNDLPPAEIKRRYTALDEQTVASATKHLQAICQQIAGGKVDYAKIGRDYRKIYRSVKAQLADHARALLGSAADLLSAEFGAGAKTLQVLLDRYEPADDARERIRRAAADYVARWPGDILTLYGVYMDERNESNVGRSVRKFCDAREKAIKDELYDIAAPLGDRLREHEHDVMMSIEDARTRYAGGEVVLAEVTKAEINDFEPETADMIRRAHELLFAYGAISRVRFRHQCVADEIMKAKAAFLTAARASCA